MSYYLMHFGIKGQRWGVRRFQNEDGSVTPEGAERYYENNGQSVGSNTNSNDGSGQNNAVADRPRKPSIGERLSAAKARYDSNYENRAKRRMQRKKNSIERGKQLYRNNINRKTAAAQILTNTLLIKMGGTVVNVATGGKYRRAVHYGTEALAAVNFGMKVRDIVDMTNGRRAYKSERRQAKKRRR